MAFALAKYVVGLETEAARLTPPNARFRLGDRVRKTRDSSWRGRIAVFYCTANTPIGYAVESAFEPGSVQVWPEAALGAWGGAEG